MMQALRSAMVTLRFGHVRRKLLVTGLLGAWLLGFWAPSSAGASDHGWPAEQLFRRGVINCYHRVQRAETAPTTAPLGDGGAMPESTVESAK
ncbi:MAG: hypothetical protein JNM83_19910 [Myxococcales bacterium]|jgi:hypothetical protein|nr:hypothetical protein [Myxococcales bacterium]